MDVELSDDLERIDYARVTALLTESYWCAGIHESEVVFSARNSALVVGAYFVGELVGFLRVISDQARFAYIADVIVDPRYQKQGIGQRMVRYAMGHERLKLVNQWLLTTSSAHGVYAKVGFKPLDHPENWMILRKERPDHDGYLRRSSEITDMLKKVQPE